MKKIICLASILVLLAVALSVYFQDSDTFLGVSYKTMEEIDQLIEEKGLVAGYLAGYVRFEQSALVVDGATGQYYITVGEAIEGNFQVNKGVTYYWVYDDTDVAEKIQQNQVFQLMAIYSGTYQIMDIKLTTMPIITIQSETIPIINPDGDQLYVDGTITVLEAEHSESKVYQETTYTMHYKLRGANSMYYAKQPFKVELLEEDGSRLSTSLLGLRTDDDWNLSALYTDNSLIREATVLSLVSDVAQLSEVPTMHPQNTVLCELFINDQYWGVYELIEPMDTQQTTINESTDFLYKGKYWDFPTAEKLLSLNLLAVDTEATQTLVESFPTDMADQRYTPLATYMEGLYGNGLSYDALCNLVDIENYMDTAILKLTLSLTDNDTKNMMYVLELQEDGTYLSRKEYFDFNSALGDDWNTLDIDPETLYFNDDLSLVLSPADYDIYLAQFQLRYEALRESALSNENIVATIDSYWDIVDSSGASLRNQSRWDFDIDMDYEYQRLMTFVAEHLEVTDAFVASLR